MIRVARVPETEPVFKGYSLEVNGEAADLFACRVSAVPYNTPWPGYQRPLDQTEEAAFLHMQADEPVTFTVTYPEAPQEVIVRPLSADIRVTLDGCRAVFTVPRAGSYTVEKDGFHGALHLFIDPPEDFGVDITDPNVRYFGPGVHHAGNITLKSGETVYLHPDAVVYGAFRALACENVRVCGYGIIDGSEEKRVTGDGFYMTDFERRLPDMDAETLEKELAENRMLWGNVHFLNCKNVQLEGCVLRDSASFSVIPASCTGVLCDRVKTIGMWRYNSDGIDVLNCTDVTIRNCFLRDFDDCVVIKGIMGRDTRPNEHITVEGCVIWCDWGRALEIGAETCATEYRDIVFRDCDVIHGSMIDLDIQHHNHAYIHDILFENIRVEFTRHQLPSVFQEDMAAPYEPKGRVHPVPMGIYIYNMGLFCEDYRNGRVSDITFRDIRLLADAGLTGITPELIGLDAEHDIRGVTFENITLNGVKLGSAEEAGLVMNEFVHDVRFL